MSSATLEARAEETKRVVTMRSIVLGAAMCALLGVAIPYFDILHPTSELGGCHFPVGPIFFLSAIIVVINFPLKCRSLPVQLLFAAALGAFVALLIWLKQGPPAAAPTRTVLYPLLVQFGPTAVAVGLWAACILFFVVVLMLLRLGGALNARELLVIFSMMLISSGIPTFGLISQLLPMMTGWQYLGEGKGYDVFYGHLPKWMVVGDPTYMLEAAKSGIPFKDVSEQHYLAIKWFYEKAPEGVSLTQLFSAYWVVPLLVWGVFIAFLYGYMFCLTSILRKQWVEREKLLFPLMQLPVEMAKGEEQPDMINPLFKSWYLIIGAAIPLLVHSSFQLKFYIMGPGGSNFMRTYGGYLAQTDLKEFGWFPIYTYFSVIGFCYLLSTEITLSVWLFWVINRMQRVAFDWTGTPGIITNPENLGAAQFIGALFVFVLFGLYAARRHLWDVVKKALTGDERIDDSEELIGHRASVIGLLVTIGGLVTWCVTMGMETWVALFVFGCFTFAIIGITRGVAECGLLFVKLEPSKPADIMHHLTGTSRMSPGSLTVLSFIQYVSMFDLKTLLMPALMHGCKARDTVKDRSKKTLFAFIAAVAVMVLVSGWFTLRECYHLGASNVHEWYYKNGPPAVAFEPLRSWINQPTHPTAGGMGFMIGGGAICSFLIFMRRSFTWWPLHPLGYLMSDGYFESSRVVFSFFLGWIIKAGVLKFVGGRWFKKLRPFFLGLILGEFCTAGLWIVIGFVLGKQGPRIFP